MKKSLEIIFLIIIIISFSSCKKDSPKQLQADSSCFENKAFTAVINGEEYGGVLNFSAEKLLELKLSSPDEINGLSIIIDSSGIKCSENDLICEYSLSDFSDDFVFLELFNLISSFTDSSGTINSSGNNIFESNNNKIIFDDDGLPLSAEVKNIKFNFT